MKCPHCLIHFHDNWERQQLIRGGVYLPDWGYATAVCPGCKKLIINVYNEGIPFLQQVFPIGANRGPVPPEVPEGIATDYVEACNVLPISANASAALSRRCLQNMLHGAGYEGRDLAKEIDLLLNEVDPLKALPLKTRQTVDAMLATGRPERLALAQP